jgi:transcriptional regulator with XRE-family HTH domain
MTLPQELPFEAARDTLARNLSVARSALGMSQDQLAEAAGVSRATIIQIEAAEGDPRLSTISGVSVALGVSPVFLLLGLDELDAIVNLPESSGAERIKENLSSDELETMRRLLRSGIAKNRTKAVAMGASAATAAGLAGALAGAAIGTSLLPGIGTAIGAALSAWVTHKRASEKKDEE